MKQILLNLWRYRYFVLSSIQTDFRSRFSRSKLGALWAVLNPLALVLVYALILSHLMRAKLPEVTTQYAYPVYILAGIVGWTLFAEIFNSLLNVFVSNANLLKKLSFPKLALPLVNIGVSLVNFLLLLLMMFVVFGFLGHLPYHALYWLPVMVVLTVMLATGLGLFFGVLNVFMRDISQVVGVVMQFWFWLTPIVYMLSIIPKEYQHYFFINPMTGITMGFQNILLYDKAPEWSLLVYPSIFACVMLVVSLVLFKKASVEMTDVL